jgi:hypothetical protein
VHAALADPAAPAQQAEASQARMSATGATPGVTWAGDVSSALSGAGAKGPDLLRLYSGPEKTEEVHF